MTHQFLPHHLLRGYPALLLVLGLAAPARATTTVTAANSPFVVNAANSPFGDDLVVEAGGELVNADGSSVFKAGSTVPVKFALTGACAGSLVATLSATKVGSSVVGAVNEAVSTSVATSGNQFRYTGGQYLFNWSTKGLTPRTCEL